LLPIGNDVNKFTGESQTRPMTRLGTIKSPSIEKWADAWNQACDLAEAKAQRAAYLPIVWISYIKNT